MGHAASSGLRFLTYLSPGLPVGIFTAIAARTGSYLGLPTSLAVESLYSGPAGADNDPFSTGEADVAFMCAPPYIWLRDREEPPVELLGVAPLFEDERAGGRAVYFSDVISRRDSPFYDFEDLRGRVLAYNDSCSLSGYYCLLEKFGRMSPNGVAPPTLLHSGSHLNSVELVAEGRADAAAIDSNVLARRLAVAPSLRSELRVIGSLGPYPIQPIVVRSGLAGWLKAGLRECLSSWPDTAQGRRELSEIGIRGFAPVDDEHYTPERAALEACVKVTASSPL